MTSLADFFTPLTPPLLLAALLLFLIFDSLGYFFNFYLVKSPITARSVYWLIGLGVFVFFWFLLGLLIPPKSSYLLFSLFMIAIITTPLYLSQKAHISLWSTIKELKFLIILFVPVLPAIWVKSSLPPYQWDELVYHYLSPWGWLNLDTWSFKGDFYANLPRTFDTLYTLLFSLTKTYAIARLFHFLTFFTVMSTSYLWLKRQFHSHLGLILPAIFLYYPADIIANSTSGYVDVAAFSMIFMAILFTIESFVDNKYINLTVVFWSLAIGIKYNSLQPLLAFGVAALLLSIGSIRVPHLKNRIFTLSLILIIFGGFWYLKNLILTGNPTFPLIFPCYRYRDVCQQGGNYFGWTLPLTLANLPTVAYHTFFGSKILAILTFTSFGFVPFIQIKKLRPILFICLGLGINFFLVKHTSGYYQRYFTYLSMIFFFLLTYLVLVPLSPKWQKLKIVKSLFTFIVLIVVVHNLPRSVTRIYSLSHLPPIHAQYALGKADINLWVKDLFPDAYSIVSWCNSKNRLAKDTFLVYDPDIIWFDYQGRFNYYLLNCIQSNQEVISAPLATIVPSLVREEKNFYIASLSPCFPSVTKKFDFESDAAFLLRQQSNELICHSKPVTKGIYYFDWRNATNSNAK